MRRSQDNLAASVGPPGSASSATQFSLLIVNSIRAYGGGEKWAIQTAQGLVDRGHRVAILCRDESELYQRSLAANLEAMAVPMPHDLSLAAIIRIARVARRWRPDILLCCSERALRLGGPAARLAGVSRVVMRDGLQDSLKPSRYNRVLARLVDSFVVNAHATRRELIGWLDPRQVEVIYNGVDLGPYDRCGRNDSLREDLGCRSEATVILSIARLVADKDHTTLIDAFRRVHEADDRACLWIAGDGPLRETLTAQCHRLGLADKVKFLGFRTDVPRLLATADILTVTSRREGMPNVILEAMAARRSVVATAVSGIPELVQDGQTGLLVPPGAPEALGRALSSLAGDPIRRREMGERGRRYVEQRFEASVSIDQWEQSLQRLVTQV